ncbi:MULTISPECIES: GNAT family N-acetyltransferase [unclassified Brevundimonas]|uniref:GNAT family N-acetyltransferase n=1 Tax=unclassified Brevundimonas TaxID=2622653 RepID=UPI000CFCCC89|nr:MULTISPECIES: GNAT family N-acetyltransferase [unclassified Brevundimonas]PRA33328.1 GNAT family N-acetyltransferase [Brevundimonas sp. MYb27]PQZ83833.1 GNAT family N-acetyltransferase [Brevundimonas sp. MYb31]PRB13762.1 GNAT family N-acetyltransferase [Brevundimonas sp. MYb52]PRB34505.1 GNAT family N-acetyltransferase [Brevundimonas sp. MYb46]PRB53983.1 GNAT family N-acetyltransferase [Brevundimonas sp. MYb33]
MILSRTYAPEDMAGCLALFDSNTPRFFDVSEREGFVGFLNDQALRWPYQVLELDGRIVGCGGHAVEADGISVALCWGMVDNGLHGQGLGKVLTEARIAAAWATPGVTHVILNTSQHTQGFYARFGFETQKVTPDGYAPGIDRWDMVLKLE